METPLLRQLLAELTSLNLTAPVVVPPVDPPVVDPPLVVVASPDGTVMPPTAAIVDAHGDVWTVDASVLTPAGSPTIAINTIPIVGWATSLTFRGGKVYAAGTDGLEYVWAGAQPWVATGVVLGPPFVPPVVVDPPPVVVPPAEPLPFDPQPSTVTGPVLTAARLKYAGVFKLPYDLPNTAFGFAGGAFTARRVNGELRFLVAGFKNAGFPVVEFAYPGVGPDVMSAPRAGVLRNWGSCYKPFVVDSQGVASSMGNLRALHWHHEQLYWAYGDEYNANGNHDPCIGTTILNPDGTFQAFGPWRTQEHPQKTRGFMLPIPEAFRNAFGTAPVGFGCPNTSGNASSPWGVPLAAGAMPPNDTPADPLGPGASMSDKFSIANQRLIYHDIDHKQSRNANYKHCGWGGSDAGGHYDPTTGYTKPGEPTWIDIDSVTAAVWVDLPDVQGFMAFGIVVDAIPGYPYEDGDTVPHNWYGPPECPHGQKGGEVSISVGPAAGSMVPKLWIYDSADLAKVAAGVLDPNAIAPTEETHISTLCPMAPRAHVAYQIGGAYFDAATRSIFISEAAAEWPDLYSPCPVIHQFVIA